jgi:hypothetical protein
VYVRANPHSLLTSADLLPIERDENHLSYINDADIGTRSLNGKQWGFWTYETPAVFAEGVYEKVEKRNWYLVPFSVCTCWRKNRFVVGINAGSGRVGLVVF